MIDENPPTAKAFRDAFIASYDRFRRAYSADDRWRDCWELHPTEPVLARPSQSDRLPPEIQESLLTQTAREMGLRYSAREQLNLDAIFSSTRSSQEHEWFPILVAIEHENDRTGFETEVDKLLSVRCPLKVGITYSLYSEEAQVQGRLQEIATCVGERFKEIRSAIEEDPKTEYLFLVGVELREPCREISRGYSLDF